METLFTNATFHSMVSEDDEFSFMTVKNGKITGTFKEKPTGKFNVVDLGGRHVYPCLIDGHMHISLTLQSIASGLNICEITRDGLKPNNLSDVETKIRKYAETKKPGEVVACYNYVAPAIKEGRLPTRFELDDWCGGRPAVVYNIDCHSSSVSTSMLEKIGLKTENFDGILTGEMHEFNQGKLSDIITARITPKKLRETTKTFENMCLSYGISTVGSLEGSGDSPKDPITVKVSKLAQKMKIGVKLYYQYTSIDRVKKFRKYQDRPRIGGCGDWELDGSVGSHSAAFSAPYKDTGKAGKCYYT